jgi:prepilin peptidase CpaA
MMIAQVLVLFIVPALLAASAGWDFASFTIPNFLSVALIAAFGIFAVAAGLTPAVIGMHALAGLLGLSVGFALFAFGLIGGGDAKLFAATAMWLGFSSLLEYVLITSLIGGGLALALLSLRKMPIPAIFAGRGWALRLHDSKSGIPYGVALAAAALIILPHTDVFLLAAG